MDDEGISEYEKRRQRNIAENRKMLESLGLCKPFSQLMAGPKNNSNIEKKPGKKRKRETMEVRNQNSPMETCGYTVVRRSLRVRGINPEDLIDDVTEKTYRRKSYPTSKRENTFGQIEGVSVGTTWLTRVECSQDGIHRPTVAGIHGSETEGCYSLALSGGYEDDIDLGESFTYTGEGGRDLKGTKMNPKNLRTAPQSKNQSLKKGNLALTKNVENRKPVRVIRGYKLSGLYAPEQGYRYDGLYTVERYWEAVGMSGYKVFKFVMSRMPDQDPPPWVNTEKDENSNSNVSCHESDSDSAVSR
eukprot:Seg226.13 transcript_id=Seg226.13/GoldUCD/mRNA.D3Y31 product="E3 ubiquitin-protein ligase UHRF1" protein_id=Seg226.13/GoldUCD/D3Y31